MAYSKPHIIGQCNSEITRLLGHCSSVPFGFLTSSETLKLGTFGNPALPPLGAEIGEHQRDDPYIHGDLSL